MSAPSIRSVPMLWVGLLLLCLAVVVWVGSVGFFMSSTMSRLEDGAGAQSPLTSMWPMLLGYGAAAICGLSGLVMTILGFIQYSHLCRAK